MALIRPHAEHREALKLIYDARGNKLFLQRDIRDKVSKSMFRKLCDYDFIVKSGKRKLVEHRINKYGKDVQDVHYVNNWRINTNDELVRRYVE